MTIMFQQFSIKILFCCLKFEKKHINDNIYEGDVEDLLEGDMPEGLITVF